MIHIYPLHEKTLHDLSDRTGPVCKCNPRLETECPEGNPLGVPIVHHTNLVQEPDTGIRTETSEDTPKAG